MAVLIPLRLQPLSPSSLLPSGPPSLCGAFRRLELNQYISHKNRRKDLRRRLAFGCALGAAVMANDARHHPSALRNREPILEALQELLPEKEGQRTLCNFLETDSTDMSKQLCINNNQRTQMPLPLFGNTHSYGWRSCAGNRVWQWLSCWVLCSQLPVA